MTDVITLNFGRYSGRALTAVPRDYLAWLAEPKFKSDNTFKVPAKISEAAAVILKSASQVQGRFRGDVDPDGKTVFVIERCGDVDGLTLHDTYEAAMGQLEAEYPIEGDGRSAPDPEDDRILIWEVLPSGHKKVIWHFSGWHYKEDEFGIEQGSLPGDTDPLYVIANRDI